MDSAELATWIRPPLLDAWYLTGPTASGKSAISLHLAQKLDAEIVSMDSMAVYRGMDIGTAKPTPSERSIAPHHLIDHVDPTEDYSVSQFIQDAHQIAAQIKERGKQVLFVGGTPLYLKSLLRGLFLGPAADWEFRQAIEADLLEYGQEALRERLWQVDPLSAHKLHPNDLRRMIRALEVARVTGRPLSHWQSQFEKGRPADSLKVCMLSLDRAWLHQRINQRVDGMFAQGLVDEVIALKNRFSQLGRTASQAVGYREVFEHLEGKFDLATAVTEVQAHTRQFARRQEIWFRSLQELRRFTVTTDDTAEQLADRILAEVRT